jgi:glyceraldehyde 3-phosphate dehydrogenase
MRGLMTTIHSYTNDQKILDMPHSDLRRARACGPEHHPDHHRRRQGHCPGHPRPEGQVRRLFPARPDPDRLGGRFHRRRSRNHHRRTAPGFPRCRATPRLKGILEAVDEPLVSMDFKGEPYSSSVDLPFTSVLGKDKSNFIKVVTWYDNEWGYSCRTADLAALMAKSL